MHIALRIVIALGCVVALAYLGFLVGLIITVGQTVPSLAGGGHATGHVHADMQLSGAIAGMILGLLFATWLWRLTGRRQS